MPIRPHKLLLVYPPYAAAASPPLGVCSLKSFVERHVPDWSVHVLDLNLQFYRDMFERLNREPIAPGPQLLERLACEILLSRAAETFRGEHPQDFFDRFDRYCLYTRLWTQAVASSAAAISKLEIAYTQNQPLPHYIQQWADLALQGQPIAIGLSICYSEQLWVALCLAKAIRQRSKLPILLGGTFFNSGAAEFLANHHEVADFVVSGEAERSLAQFLVGDMRPDAVPGFNFMCSGQVVSNEPVVEKDLDLLGDPDFSDLDLKAYYSPLPVLPILTSRGCYWRRCAFCTHYKSAGLTYRQRRIDAVIAELTRHVKSGIRHFALIDEMIAPGRFAHLAAALQTSDLKLFYYALAKPTRQFTRPLLEKMYRSGCRYILWGVETGAQRLLDLMDKGTILTDVENVLETAAAVGIKNHVYVMVGFPTETRAEFQATLNLLARHKQAIAMVHRGLFQLEKHSPVFDHPERFSLTGCSPAGTSGTYQFECASGMNRQEQHEAFAQSVPWLRTFATSTPELGDFVFREHALLRYSQPVK